MEQQMKSSHEIKCEMYFNNLVEEMQQGDKWLTTLFQVFSKAQNERLKKRDDIAEDSMEYFRNRFHKGDVALYLLLRYYSEKDTTSVSPEIAAEMKSLICGNIEVDWSSVSTEFLSTPLREVTRLLTKGSSLYPFNDQIDGIIRELSQNGVGWDEPFSYYLLHSEQIVYSEEEKIARLCLYLSSLNEEERNNVKSWMGFNTISGQEREGRTIEEIETEKNQGFEEAYKDWRENKKFNVSTPFEDIDFSKIVEDIKSGKNSLERQPNKYYDGILLYRKDSLCTLFDYSILREKVKNNGLIIYALELEYEERNTPIVKDFLKSLLQQKELDAFLKDELQETQIFVLKKGKTDSTVHVLAPINYNQQNDYNNFGRHLQYREIEQKDLAAIGYEINKVIQMPIKLHFGDDERLAALGDILNVNNGELVKETTTGHVFTWNDYAKDYDTFVVMPEQLKVTEVDSKWKKITTPTFAIRMPLRKINSSNEIIGLSRVKVAYIMASAENPVYFRDYEATFSVKEDQVEPFYLYYLTQKGTMQDIVNLAISDMVWGLNEANGQWDATPMDCGKTLLNVAEGTFPIPSKEEQIKLYTQVGMDEKNKKLIEAYETYKKEIHRRKHAMSPVVHNLKSYWKVLQTYIRRNGGTMSLHDYIGEENPVTVEDWCGSITENLQLLSVRTSHLADEDTLYGEVSKIHLPEFIPHFCQTHKDEEHFNFMVDREVSTSADIVFSKEELTRVMEQIVNNAKEHGFKTTAPNRNIIKIGAENEEKEVILTVSNNGAPILLDPVEKVFDWGESTSLGIDGHNGIGGDDIKRIMFHYGGRVSITSTPQEEFKVTYILHIPKF